jgi:hypothetical protein
MSRKTALRLDDDSLERTARVSSTRRGRNKPSDGRLVGEVIEIGFDRCESHSEPACAKRPSAICTGCGSARCVTHECTSCNAASLEFATADFNEVLDTRLRLVR